MNNGTSLRVDRIGAVGTLELARSDKHNALSVALTTALPSAFDVFERPESGLRAVLVKAQGRDFCTGADLGEVISLRADADAVRKFIGPAHQTMRRIEASPLPVVVACQGL